MFIVPIQSFLIYQCSVTSANVKIDLVMVLAPLEHLWNVVTGYYPPIGVNLNMLNIVY